MSSAVSSSLRSKRLQRRKPSSGYGRIALKTASIGVAVATTAVVLPVAAIVGGGQLFAITREAHASTRSTFVKASSTEGRVQAALAAGELPYPVVQVASLPAEDVAPAKAVAANQVATLAIAVPVRAATRDEPSEQFYTGSIGAYSSKPAASEPAAPVAVANFAPPASEQPKPLPRARPKLAALTPFNELGLLPNGETRSIRAAIYDITAQIVYLPSGERLEAHSGLGSLMDDPRHIHVKNRGATPPNTYKLTYREALFHGVRALRLTPVGDEKMYNRDGILAHTYLLGPSGQSNGCVSFKEYARFLRAFERGDIDHIVVVARLSKAPAYYARTDIRSARAL
jgi:hypothetical protein